jgi:hypothetical protein
VRGELTPRLTAAIVAEWGETSGGFEGGLRRWRNAAFAIRQISGLLTLRLE